MYKKSLNIEKIVNVISHFEYAEKELDTIMSAPVIMQYKWH